MKKEICWNITARCNQACKYCHRFLNIQDLLFEDNKKILENLYNSGITNITWTGGEALLLDGIDELLKISYNKGIKNKIITNGKLLTKEKIDKIYKYLECITISIDSIDNETNEILGRGFNHFQEVKEILDYIKEKNYCIRICINCVICKQNLNNVIELMQFLNNYEIYSLRVFKFMPLRETAVLNKDYFNITDSEYDKVVNSIKANSNINKIETRVQSDMERKYILILANGDIFVTENGIDKKIGNALTTDISSICFE